MNRWWTDVVRCGIGWNVIKSFSIFPDEVKRILCARSVINN